MSAAATESLVIPRVTGRHQDKALALARKQRAIELRMTGMTYQQVADAMGYKKAGTVYTIIKTAQEQHVAATVHEERDRELERLDGMQASLWPDVELGHLPAVRVVLRARHGNVAQHSRQPAGP